MQISLGGMMAETSPYAKVVARAWKDPAFKKKLLSDPKAALKEMGIDIPKDATIKIIEEAPKTHILILPASPTNANELHERELVKLAAAGESNGVSWKTDEKVYPFFCCSD